MPKFHRTDILKIDPRPIYSEINAASASVWNECLYQMSMYQWHRGYPHAWNFFYIGDDCEGWIDKHLSKSQSLHSQSIQAVRERYFKSWKSYGAVKKSNPHARPPRKQKAFLTTRWKKSAIRFEGNCVILSMGLGRDKLRIPLPPHFNMSKTQYIATIDLVYNFGRWELHFSYKYETEDTETGEGVVGVDIGEIHPIVSYDGQDTQIFNGRYIRSLYRLRNKVLAEFGRTLSRCKRHSHRWWKLTRRKWKRIKKIDNQIKDALHQHTAKFLKYCKIKGIGTIVLGDLTGIRDTIDYGKRSNQKLHQWAFGKITSLITYKAKVLGIKVVQIDEAYTSQTCPKCGNRKKPNTRDYTCRCGFQYHRDGVGAINIREKYLGHFGVPVVADMDTRTMKMTPPLGFRLKVPVALD